MNTRDALLDCLPPVAYARQAPQVLAEATSVASVVDGAIGLSDGLVEEGQPDTAVLAFSDWERNYGLPDACIQPATLAQRRANLMGRLKRRGNLSRPFMIDQAAALGYPGCTITEFGPMTCMDPCDSPCNGSDFIGLWSLNVPVATTIVYATCESPCDVPLAKWGNTQLECIINRRKPAHTHALFAYAS